jgi:hypothetical protein
MTSANIYPAVWTNTNKIHIPIDGDCGIIRMKLLRMNINHPVMKYGFLRKPEIGTQSLIRPYITLKHHGTAITVNNTLTSAAEAPLSTIKYTISGVRNSCNAMPMKKYDIGIAIFGNDVNSSIQLGKYPLCFIRSSSSSVSGMYIVNPRYSCKYIDDQAKYPSSIRPSDKIRGENEIRRK